MPLKRTPPKISTSQSVVTASTASLSSRESLLQHYDSAPDLNIPQEQIDKSTKILRSKRRRNDSGDMNPYVEELKSMFNKFSLEQTTRFSELQQTVANIERQNTDISKCLEFLSAKYEETLTKIQTLKEERAEDKKRIHSLEDKIEQMERKNRVSGLEIRNVPLSGSETGKSESKEDLSNIVKCMGKSLNIEVHDAEIKDVYRINTNKEFNKTIITEFSSVIKRDKILEAIKKFNKNKAPNDKLNTSHLNLKVPKKTIFVSETLTQKTRRLFYLSREYARNNGYAFCWTSRGVIYLRKAENMPLYRINDESDLPKPKQII